MEISYTICGVLGGGQLSMLYHPAYDARGNVWWMVVLRMLSSPGDTILTPFMSETTQYSPVL